MQDLSDPQPTPLKMAAAVTLASFALAIYIPVGWCIAVGGLAITIKDHLCNACRAQESE